MADGRLRLLDGCGLRYSDELSRTPRAGGKVRRGPLEYMPGERRLLVGAGVGWEPGTIGNISLGIDMESPAGYAFHTGQIVISNHLQDETRFPTPTLLADHGVKRAINVLIARGGAGHLQFGVLEVDSPDLGQFDLADANFLAGFAGDLGIVIERRHADAELQSSLDH